MTTTEGALVVPTANAPDWIDFLRWYSSMGCPASDIIDIVEKPWHYGDAYAEYLEAGGLER